MASMRQAPSSSRCCCSACVIHFSPFYARRAVPDVMFIALDHYGIANISVVFICACAEAMRERRDFDLGGVHVQVQFAAASSVLDERDDHSLKIYSYLIFFHMCVIFFHMCENVCFGICPAPHLALA